MALALSRGQYVEARECGQHALGFVQVALAHVASWHPAISTVRLQLAEAEAGAAAAIEGSGAGGSGARYADEPCVEQSRSRALSELNLALAALMISHGPEHDLTQRAEKRQLSVLVAAEVTRRRRLSATTGA